MYTSHTQLFLILYSFIVLFHFACLLLNGLKEENGYTCEVDCGKVKAGSVFV
jgi:hypothetical protein